MKSLSLLPPTFVLPVVRAVPAYQPQPPAVGSPDHVLPSSNQEDAQVWRDQFKEKWVVLYFHRKDFISGCAQR
jgi:hypothetical protein